MDDKQLAKMLEDIQAPAPKETRKKQTLDAAMAAFDKNISQNAQGFDVQDRLMDREPKTGSRNIVRRFFMQKNRSFSGMTGAVALCALVAVLGTPFLIHEAHNIMGPEKEVAKSVTAKTEPSADQIAAAKQDVQPVYQHNTIAAKEMKPQATGQMSAVAFGQPAPAPMPESKVMMLAKPSPVVRQRADAGAQDASRREAFAPRIKDKSANGAEVQSMSVPAVSPSQGMAQERAIIMPVVPGVISSPPMERYQPPFYQPNSRDSFPDYKDNGVTEVASKPVSTFSIDVDTSSYSFVRRSINEGHLPPRGAVRLEELINYFHYNYAVPQKDADPFLPSIAVFDCPWRQGDKLVHIGIKGYVPAERPQSNIVFLIDTSGSMNRPDRLPLLISSFKLMLESLKPDDTVGIVTYAGNAGVALEPTPARDKAKILSVLDSLSAGGSTAGAQGLQAAYQLANQAFIKGGNNRILLATDGDFNVGVSSAEGLKDLMTKERDRGIYLSVLGFGMGNYQDTTMQTLAQNGNGNASYIDNLSEARKVLVEEARSTLFTIAKDVKIQVEFNPAAVQEYRLLGYETRHLNREDFNNDKVDAGEVGAGHAVTAIYEITPVGAKPLVDKLRYGAADAKSVGTPDEYAFLKIRYKKPDSDASTLMTRPITKADEKSFDDLSDDSRFATAVAGFAQLLRGSTYIGNLNYDQVIDMASKAKGTDEDGYRAEFVNLVKLAKSEAGLTTPAPQKRAPIEPMPYPVMPQ